MFVQLPQAQAQIDSLLAEQRWNDALANLVVGVHNTHRDPAWQHGHLHYPAFDRHIEQLAQVVPQDETSRSARALHGTLIVATELYPVGGHSRVVADLLREVEQPTLVLTDLFGNYRKVPDHLNWVLQENPRATVLVLRQSTLWLKCLELQRLAQRLAPRNILYLQHHQDPLAFVGTLGHAGSRKTLVHHCDHNPSLGGTLAGVGHVDFTRELAEVCERTLQRPTLVMPLHVPDAGVRRFAAIQGREWSVVTSGSHIKFARAGKVALQAIACTVLKACDGRFTHIGPLAEDWQVEIRAHLAAQGLDPARFVTLGPVPSLWQTLAGLDAHLYLGSAPAGGGRAAIEAQGCGFPVAFYRSDIEASTTLKVDSVYASATLGWAGLDDLPQLLADFPGRQGALSATARALYDAHYGRQAFLDVVRQIAG